MSRSATAPTAPPRADLLATLLLLAFALLIGACATRRESPPTSLGERIAANALDEIGRRYRFGGTGEGGFDCSGLAFYVHAREGVALPRTALEQSRGGTRIDRGGLRAGDLVFFRFTGAEVDHVGVYVGGGEFVHAPGSGDTVRRVPLAAPWFAQRYAGAMRFWRD